jgi:hypothetical protein
MPCRHFRVAPPSIITRRLADDGVLAIFTRSLRRPTIAHPEALAWVASPRQAQLQIFDLALIPIVELASGAEYSRMTATISFGETRRT